MIPLLFLAMFKKKNESNKTCHGLHWATSLSQRTPTFKWYPPRKHFPHDDGVTERGSTEQMSEWFHCCHVLSKPHLAIPFGDKTCPISPGISTYAL